MSSSKSKKSPVWYESSKRHAYQAFVGPDCTVAIAPDRRPDHDDEWRWRVGRGELTHDAGPFDPVQGFVAKEGRAMTRNGAKRAALQAAKKACPVRLDGAKRKRR
jgi:hypothetical protein